MKKLIAVTMVLVLMVSFAGCGAVDKYLDLAGGVVENMENVQTQQNRFFDLIEEQSAPSLFQLRGNDRQLCSQLKQLLGP